MSGMVVGCMVVSGGCGLGDVVVSLVCVGV